MTKLPRVHELTNKLRCVVIPRHRTKIVSIQIWVKVGSIHEQAGEHGIAHFIEHMLFKGTPHHSVGEVSSLIENMGGDINAYTTFDHTVIHATVLSEFATDALLLLKQAVIDSVFDAAELDNERQVIIEEIKRSMDDPGSILGHTVLDQVYHGTPYARPIFGTLESVERLKRDQIVAFHQRWYRPNNMFVVISGDVGETEAVRQVNDIFGGIEGSAVEASEIPQGRFQAGRQINLLKSENQLPRIELTLPAPDIEHGDAAALNLICFMIGHSENGPMAAEMRDRLGIVAAASCNFHLSSYRGMISFSFVPEQGEVTTVINRTLQLIENIKSGHFMDELALKTAKANFLVDRVHEEETVDGLARTYGSCLLTDYGVSFEDLFQSRTTQCQLDDVLAVASRWFQTENFALVVQIPEDHALDEGEVEKALVLKDSVLSPSAEIATGPRGRGAPKHRTIFEKTGTKATLAFHPFEDSALVSLVCVASGGLRVEKDGEVGMQHAIGSLIANATSDMNSQNYTQLTESLGASISGFSGKDSVGIRAQCLVQDFERMSDLLVDSLFRPVIELEKLETFRRQMLQTIAAEGDSPAGIAMRRFQEKIFADHPYRYPLYGSKELVDSLSLTDVQHYAESYLASQSWIVSVAGGVDVASAVTFAQKFQIAATEAEIKFGRNPKAPRVIVSKDRPTPKDQKKEQVHVVLGGRGVSWDDPIRAAVDVVTAILGGAGGRLFIELRDKAGLVYTVSPFANHGLQAGLLGVYFACQPKNVATCKEIIAQQISQLQTFERGEEELVRAKQFILGGHESELQRTEAIAMNTALMTLYGLGPDEFEKYRSAISRVSALDVRNAVARYFNVSGWILSEVGG